MVGVILLAIAVAAAVVGNVLDGRKHLDLHDVVHARVGVDRTLADVA
jgi:hypothetical protein